jgi:hypothetical protein
MVIVLGPHVEASIFEEKVAAAVAAGGNSHVVNGCGSAIRF